MSISTQIEINHLRRAIERQNLLLEAICQHLGIQNLGNIPGENPKDLHLWDSPPDFRPVPQPGDPFRTPQPGDPFPTEHSYLHPQAGTNPGDLPRSTQGNPEEKEGPEATRIREG